MRPLLFFFLMIASRVTVAQTNLQDQRATSSPSSPQVPEQSSANPEKPPQPTELYGFRNRYSNTCLFIRSYNFERNGTEAPRLKSVTTCTPARSDQFRQTEKQPQPRLIPAN
jgi:hypothetical protein